MVLHIVACKWAIRRHMSNYPQEQCLSWWCISHLSLVTGHSQLRSATSRTCIVRRTYSNYGDRCFAAAGPKVWNSLPAELRQADISFQRFKRLLKTFLFRCWDRGALWLTVKAAPGKFSYLLTANTTEPSDHLQRLLSLRHHFLVVPGRDLVQLGCPVLGDVRQFLTAGVQRCPDVSQLRLGVR